MLSMESTSNRMTRLGKSIITDTELLTFERIIAEIDAVEAATVSELCALLLAPERSRRRDRAERGAVPRGGRAGQPRPRGARRGVRFARSWASLARADGGTVRKYGAGWSGAHSWASGSAGGSGGRA